jgi:hypothetical protein
MRFHPPPQNAVHIVPGSSSYASDRLLYVRVLALDAGLDHARVAEDDDRRGADEPEDDADGRRDPEERDANDEESGVE